MTGDKKEAFPLSWPTDWPRTRLADQRTMASWKRSANDYREELAKELDRRKAPIAIISTNVPLSVRGQIIASATASDFLVIISPSKSSTKATMLPSNSRFRRSESLTCVGVAVVRLAAFPVAALGFLAWLDAFVSLGGAIGFMASVTSLMR